MPKKGMQNTKKVEVNDRTCLAQIVAKIAAAGQPSERPK